MADTFAADKKTDQEEKEQLMQLVGFTIGNEQFGVDILMVQEIIRSAPITSVPNSPEFIEGVINLRGNIIPVIELRKRLNLFQLGSSSKESWILILDINGRVTGFIVDSVTRVLKILESTIEPPPEVVVAGLANQYIRGVCDIGEGLLIMLDFNRILLADELKLLKAIEGE
ncbi:MAG: purine-binding chemotaxis protein CheW [Candidatus Electrothrix sp. AX5]|jgi:purine-binding chemotaxis protein CheW|uniref:Purine-binding chemotaxis protein CheW n=1 Tax=Candidatus Electrothrix aarhusensis TaxID=1859131 RepID=A0A3S3U8D0_9BACT|nr:purine-binding chemotaxis protein CheW [Candidatus Electrothrix sp. AX5]RWX44500.1 purine-binding chemotaxis protein CheW [Candidatus Electrothrix aarhusensis]